MKFVNISYGRFPSSLIPIQKNMSKKGDTSRFVRKISPILFFFKMNIGFLLFIKTAPQSAFPCGAFCLSHYIGIKPYIFSLSVQIKRLLAID